jgi:hypothetical protein
MLLDLIVHSHCAILCLASKPHGSNGSNVCGCRVSFQEKIQKFTVIFHSQIYHKIWVTFIVEQVFKFIWLTKYVLFATTHHHGSCLYNVQPFKLMNNTSDGNYNETHMHVVMSVIHLYYIFGDLAIGWSVR